MGIEQIVPATMTTTGLQPEILAHTHADTHTHTYERHIRTHADTHLAIDREIILSQYGGSIPSNIKLPRTEFSAYKCLEINITFTYITCIMG